MNRNIGLIGLGNMGHMILDQLLSLNLLKENEVYVSNRGREKLEAFKDSYKSVNLCESNIEVAKNCGRIMLCVEPLNVPAVLLEIKPYLNEESYLMISTSTVEYEDLYKIYKGKITKFMPTLNSTVRGGVTLACHNEWVSVDDKEYFEGLMSSISQVSIITEDDFNLCHNLTGSLPAVISEIMHEFVKAGAKHRVNITEEEIERMVKVSLLGSARLLVEKNLKFEDTIRKVSTKGGITYEGIKIYEKTLPPIFEQVFDITTKKYTAITENASRIVDELIK